MKKYNGKEYAWVNQLLVDGVYVTIWRGIKDPKDVIKTEAGAKEKDKETVSVIDTKITSVKAEWQKTLDKKKPPKPTPTPDPKPKAVK